MKNFRVLIILSLLALAAPRLAADTIDVYDPNNAFTSYDLFGNKLVENHQLLYELSHLGGKDTEYSGASPSATFYKRKYPFGDPSGVFKGFVSFYDTLFLNMSLEYILSERAKKNMYSPYLLKNNFLDGVFFKLEKPKWFKVQNAFSRLSTGTSQLSSEADFSTSDRITIGTTTPQIENDFLWAANIDTTPQTLIRGIANKAGYGVLNWFDFQNFRFSYLNMHHRNSDENTVFSRGRVNKNSAFTQDESIYVKISSLANNNPKAFASLYELKAADQNNIGLSFTTTGTGTTVNDPDGKKVTNIYGGNSMVYKINLPYSNSSGEKLSRVTVYVKAANAYLVQVSKDGNFQTVNNSYDGAGANSTGLTHNLPSDAVLYGSESIKDYANTEYRSFEYGNESAVNIFGLGYKIRLGPIFLKGDLNFAQTWKQYPNSEQDGAYSKTLAKAGNIFVGFKFDNKVHVSSKNEFYLADPEYRAYFRPAVDAEGKQDTFYAVVDNDNNDYRTPLFNLYEATEQYENMAGNDRNNNGIEDFAEPFLIFNSLPSFFAEGDDLNNNDVMDSIEDDQRLDYTHDINLKGFSSDTTFSPVNGLMTRFLFLNEQRITLDRMNRVIMGELGYTATNGNFFTRAQFGYRRVMDDIPNNVSQNKGSYNTTIRTGIDALLYTNSHVLSPLLLFGLRGKTGFYFETRMRSVINFQADEESTVFHDGLVLDVGYNKRWKLFKRDLIGDLGTRYQKERQFVNDNRINKSLLDNYSFFAVGPRLEYRMGDASTLLLGYQYTEYRDEVAAENSYRGQNLAWEVNFGGAGKDVQGRHVTMATGFVVLYKNLINIDTNPKRIGSYYYAKLYYNY